MTDISDIRYRKLVTIDEIKSSIIKKNQIACIFGLILGYDDDKSAFLVRNCSGDKQWLPYSDIDKDTWTLEEKKVNKNDYLIKS